MQGLPPWYRNVARKAQWIGSCHVLVEGSGYVGSKTRYGGISMSFIEIKFLLTVLSLSAMLVGAAYIDKTYFRPNLMQSHIIKGSTRHVLKGFNK